MVIIDNKIVNEENEVLFNKRFDTFLALQEARTDLRCAESNSEKQQAQLALDQAFTNHEQASEAFFEAHKSA